MSSNEPTEHTEHTEKVPEKLTKGQRREKAILQSAIEAFVKYGYSGTTIGKIIEVSGGSRSTIYAAYGSKLGLFKAAVENLVLEVYEEYTKVYDPKRPWEEEMVVFGEIYLRDMLKPRVVALTRLIYSEAARFPQISEWAYENSV
ncbi:MAG: TetR/AcrR family transcriptional regulator [Burkholderiales bacterium]|nr:TetR/AcrR family transcriptional regulator [Burkholderiales bacterium]